MTVTKEKAASPWQGKAAEQTNLKANNTSNDPLRQWFELAKHSRAHQQKNSWKWGRK